MQIAERVLRRASLPALLVVGIVVTIPGNWLRVQNVDPQFAMVLVQRTMHFGGTFYDNAVQDHGPIEPFLYDVAARIAGINGAWYVISAMATAVSVALAVVAARTARMAGAAREVATAAGVAVFVHFTISRSSYAGVLYIRNMTTLLLALAWLVLIADRPWLSPRRRRLAVLVVGALLGLAVQSLLSTFAAGVLGVVAIATVWTRVELRERLPLAALMAGSALVTFVSAPVYYAVRGDFTQFWSGWVRYGEFMAVGPGRSTTAQLSRGWTVFVGYYEHRALAWAVILAFLVALTAIWRTADVRSRVFHVGLVAWWAAGWFELALSQRYSAEYFAVTSAPTALMAAAVAGHAWRAFLSSRVRARALVVLPLATAIVAVMMSSTANFDNDVRAAWNFRGVNKNATIVALNRRGVERSTLAVLDLVSHNGDPLLVWTDDPWPYLNLNRVSATRFFYKSFLLGEIYQGRTSSAYVLPDTWKWFAQDLKQTNPVAYLRADEPNLPTGNPFATYVERNFDVVYPDAVIPVSFRNDAARQVLLSGNTRPWRGRAPTVSRTGWKVHGSTATYKQGPVAGTDDQLTLATDSCFRLAGVINRGKADGLGQVEFFFDDNAGKAQQLKLSFNGDYAASSTDFSDIQRDPTQVAPGAPRVTFALVVGRHSAALVVNGKIRAAVLLPPSVTVTAESGSPLLRLSGLRVGAAPAGSGC